MAEDFQFIDGTRLSRVVEALIFSSEEALKATRICELLQDAEGEAYVEPQEVEEIVEMLNEQYNEQGRAFYIDHVAGGYLFVTREKYHNWLQVQQHREAYRRLSPSALEALAIIAYKQPLTKPQVDDIRGVDSGYMVRQLLEKNLIEVAGRAKGPGKPLLYQTTKDFLQHFGINSVDELPRPREIEDILSDDDMSEHRQFLMDFENMQSGEQPSELKSNGTQQPGSNEESEEGDD